jgi:hypothetical protein
MANCYIKEFGVIDEHIQRDIFEYVKKCNQTFGDSLLYSSHEKELLIDKNIRSSQFRAIKDDKLFRLFDNLIKKLNAKDQQQIYTMVHNDVTHIKYKEGDFFKIHEDYLSVTSNFVEEYTMILCMDANCVGGETIFHFNDYFKYVCKETITPYHSVIFRKDIKHEGSEIISGNKDILTINLLACKKSYGKYIVIRFENDERYYILSINDVNKFKWMLNSKVEFESRNDNVDVHTYIETIYTYEDFSVIYDIIKGCNISHTKIDDKFFEMIDYYCIHINNVFIDMNDDGKGNIAEKDIFLVDFCNSMILCKTLEDTSYLTEIVKKGKLRYVPFTMIFVDGYYVENNIDSTKYDMVPIFISITEYNHLMYYDGDMMGTIKGFNKMPKRLYNQYLKCKKNEDTIMRTIIDKKYTGLCRINCEHFQCIEDYEKIMIYMCTGNINFIEIVRDYIETSYDNKTVIESKEKNINVNEKKMLTLIQKSAVGGDENFLEMISNKTSINDIDAIIENHDQTNKDGEFNCSYFYVPSKNDIEIKHDFYCTDKNNKMFLSNDQYKNILKSFDDQKLIEVVKEKLKSTSKLNFPQKKIAETINLCNESIYANTTFICISGLMRVDEH